MVVVGLCAAMGVMVYRRQKQTYLFRQGEEAYKQGSLDVARQKLSAYVRRDPSHEKSWLYLAEIYEKQLLWSEAALAWQRLVNLNVLNEDYINRQVMANYRAHDFASLDRIFSNFSHARLMEYSDIYALTVFSEHPDAEGNDSVFETMSKDGAAARLIRAIKNKGPVSEFEALENCDDPVIQVEALRQDAFLSEFTTKDLKRAEQCHRKASSINPDLCSASMGDFLFRNVRYNDAKEAYKSARLKMMTVDNVLNYAEVLFFLKDEDALLSLKSKIHYKNITIRAYIQSLVAYLHKDSADMIKNYRSAQLQRTTPVGLLLTYAVGVEDSDIPLLVSVLSRWRRTRLFKEKKDEILAQTQSILVKAMKEGKLKEAAELAQIFLQQEPPVLICWQIVVLDHIKRGIITDALLQQACKLFPKERLFYQQRLRLAFAKGNQQEILDLYDQMISTSDEPGRVRYAKVVYLERQMQLDKAFEELKTILKEDHSIVAGKQSLAFGIRTGNKEALKMAEEFSELADIAQFEMERRYGDLDKATQMLASKQLEKGLTAEKQEDREIMLPLAICLALAQEYERSKVIYAALLPYSGDNVIIDLNLSEIFSHQGDALLALEHAANAYKKKPSSALVQTVYGIRYYEMKDYERAVAMIPNNVSGEHEKAVLIECLEKILASSFEEEDMASFRKTIRRLQLLQPDNECAKEYLEKLDKRNKEDGQYE